MSEGSNRRGVVRTSRGESLRPVGRPRRSIGQKLLLTLGAVSTVLLVLSAGVLFWANQVLGDVQTIPVEGLSTSDGGVSNWLLVGTDSREGIDSTDPNSGAFLDGSNLGGRRTDTIMVARVNTKNSTIRLLSVPRDLWVDIPGQEKGRVNSSFNGEGGPARLVETVELNLGIKINQYAEVNFVGFQDVIDALGGVPMYFETPMRDPNTGLNIETAGCHTLDGIQALAFARTRKLQYFEDGEWRTDGSSDLGRTTRQRYFLTRVADATAAKANLFDVDEFNQVARAAGQNLQISSGTSTTDLLSLARTFRAVGSEGIESYSLPVVDARIGDAAVLELKVNEAQDVLNLFRESEDLPEGTVGKASFTTSVLNGSGTQGQASSASGALESQGFKIGEIGDASQTATTTIIRYGPGQEAAAKTVAIYINNDVTFQSDPGIDGVTLVTGSNFEGIRVEPVDVEGPAPSVAEPAPPAEDNTVVTEPITETEEATGVVPAEEDQASECTA